MIEEAIAKLTAAVEANTVALNAILASAGTAPVPVETPKKEKAPAEEQEDPKPAKKKPLVEVKAAPKLEVVEPEEEAPAAAEPKHTIQDAIKASMDFLKNGGTKDQLAELRKSFGENVATVKDIAADQVDAYMEALAAL